MALLVSPFIRLSSHFSVESKGDPAQVVGRTGIFIDVVAGQFQVSLAFQLDTTSVIQAILGCLADNPPVVLYIILGTCSSLLIACTSASCPAQPNLPVELRDWYPPFISSVSFSSVEWTSSSVIARTKNSRLDPHVLFRDGGLNSSQYMGSLGSDALDILIVVEAHYCYWLYRFGLYASKVDYYLK